MQHLSPLDLLGAPSAATTLSPADYVHLLHPEGSRGRATIVLIHDTEHATSRTFDLAALPWAAETVLDGPAYLALNRYWGPRGRSRLAALNAMYLDLDFWRLPQWQGRSPQHMAALLSLSLERRRIPQPSLVLDTGRGFAALWLLEELVPAAEPRWRAAMTALIRLHREFGADPACSDPARVFRLPGTVNGKARRPVSIIGGTLRRHGFDCLADTIWHASGRPTRAELEARPTTAPTKAEPGQTPSRPRGLPTRARFIQITRDLDRLRQHWGGQVPEGWRNSWLHVFATCLTHTREPDEIEALVETEADRAVPGLPRSEIRSLIATTLKRASAPRAASPQQDGRLTYSGARLAELLGVTDDMARELRLEQIMSVEERARRKAEREQARRAGAVPREAYLEAHALSRTKPWEAQGMTRATWYRRKRQAMGQAASDADGGKGADQPL